MILFIVIPLLFVVLSVVISIGIGRAVDLRDRRG